MTCADVQDHIDDFVDGRLPEAEYQELELHLAGCASCRRAERGWRALLAQAAALPREREPGSDLWPGIAARLRPGRALPFGLRLWLGGLAGRRWMLPALAGAAAALVALWTLLPRSTPAPGGAGLEGHALPAVATGGGGLREAEAEYSRATAELLQAIDARRESLPPETAAALDRNLRTIDEALGDIRAALDHDPQNAQLARLLNATHRRKVAFLQQLVKLSTQL